MLECASGGYFRIQSVTPLDHSRVVVMGTNPEGTISLIGVATLELSVPSGSAIPVEILYSGTEVSGHGDCDWEPKFPELLVVLDTSRHAISYFSLTERSFRPIADETLVDDLSQYSSISLFAGSENGSDAEDVLMIRLENEDSAPAHHLQRDDVERWLWDAGADGVLDLVQ